jgi:hypothetical protein
LVIPVKGLRVVPQRLRRARPDFAAFNEVARRFAMDPIASPEREANNADGFERTCAFWLMRACSENEATGRSPECP